MPEARKAAEVGLEQAVPAGAGQEPKTSAQQAMQVASSTPWASTSPRRTRTPPQTAATSTAHSTAATASPPSWIRTPTSPSPTARRWPPTPPTPPCSTSPRGTGWSNLGTDIYRYDGRRDRVTTTHNSHDRVTSIAFNPASQAVMYLGLTEES
ncbi:hypothetical protein ABZW11_41320 [Nonomuraea sp. NPDC004580]|uniref:hypothetical protein n=1 Tax=Nonomuraea sp. NPDC004580 TaxID=3154552 RepID=UPI0033B98C0A